MIAGGSAVLIIARHVMCIMPVKVTLWARIGTAHALFDAAILLICLSTRQCFFALLRTIDRSCVFPVGSITLAYVPSAKLGELTAGDIIYRSTSCICTEDMFRAVSV